MKKPRGCSWDKKRGKWKGLIAINGKQKFIGYFNTEEEAYEAYCDACIKYGYENRINGYFSDENVRKRKLEYANDYGKATYTGLKEEVLEAYGRICVCCGENEPKFLTIDHIDQKGAEHRRELKKSSGSLFYRWLKNNNFPKDNFQLLCYNCNCAKYRLGYCPHTQPRYQG